MSIAKHYTLFCDGCRRVGPHWLALGGHPDGREARKDARKYGWKRIPKGSPDDQSRAGRGEDLCRSCAAKRTDN